MTLSERSFSPVHSHDDIFIINSLGAKETAFQATYDMPLRRAEQDGLDDVPENEPEPEVDSIDQQIADAYARGYLNGQRAAMVQLEEGEASQDTLASSINRLKTIDAGHLSKQLWEVVLSLFEQAVGHARTNKKLLQERCDAAIELIAADVGEVCLYVAAADTKLLQNHDCPVPVLPDANLLPGSVRLVYGSGEITSGSTAMAQEIENKARLAGGASC
ncbi:MAG: hypothetical protein Pars92KO_09950 [Parasphingorhabdus sp.]